MAHRKKNHPNIIRYFVQGNCAFEDDVCWLSHKVYDKNRATSFPQTLKELKCSLCEIIFKNKSDFMTHRKDNHPQNISTCRDDKNGVCRFRAEECWYKHISDNQIKILKITKYIIWHNGKIPRKDWKFRIRSSNLKE